MFTGIVEHCGTIESVSEQSHGIRVTIRSQFSDLVPGESVAFDGICLTVTDPKHSVFECDLSPETCRLTTASEWTRGASVNLERALQMNDRLGGHFVMGHVDETAKVTKREQLGEYTEVHFGEVSKDGVRYLFKKGSVAVNGVSLTINTVNAKEGAFSVMLIPHTLERTNLSDLEVGSLVNLEFDWLARAVVSRFEQMELSHER